MRSSRELNTAPFDACLQGRVSPQGGIKVARLIRHAVAACNKLVVCFQAASETQWQHDTLAGLVKGLREYVDPDPKT